MEAHWESFDSQTDDGPVLDRGMAETAKEVFALEESVAALKQVIETACDGELRRVNREWHLGNMTKLPHIKLRDILATVVGTEIVDRKMG
jgi:hypothetical protein